MRMRYLAIVLCCLITCACTKAPPKAGPVAFDGIEHLYRWPTQVGTSYSASQPSKAALSKLQSLGVKTVINLRAPGELTFNERKLVEGLGLNYVFLPVTPQSVSLDTVEQFVTHLQSAESYPLLVHCSSGNRAALMLALGEVFTGELTVHAALAKANALGMTKEPLQAKLRDLAEQRRAHEALRPLQKQLMQALTSALAEGPEAGLAACRLKAPALATQASTGGFTVGRTSHRLRNPDNAPREWVKPLLTEYVAAQPPLPTGRTVTLPGQRIGYVEPIYMKPLCTTCHGGNLTPSLQSRLRELYPHDQATGFATGDFRGLFWVEMPAE